MSKKGVRKRPGLAPGSLVYTGTRASSSVRVHRISYNEADYHETEISLSRASDLRVADNQTGWIMVQGIHDVGLMEHLGSILGIHPLTLEDILNLRQRPKIEDYGEYLYLVTHVPRQGKDVSFEFSQLSLLLIGNRVVTFMDEEDNLFAPVLDRLRENRGRIRQMKSDYLTYALIDAAVDRFFYTLEDFDERLINLEEELMENPCSKSLEEIHRNKRSILELKRILGPQREIINSILRKDFLIFSDDCYLYLRDVYDHVIRLSERLDSFRDINTGLHDLYLSSVSNRMNEVMKVLTIIATLFIPVTFIAGIYGMNFEFMPELKSPWGYPIVIGIMLGIMLAMLAWFRKKKWL